MKTGTRFYAVLFFACLIMGTACSRAKEEPKTEAPAAPVEVPATEPAAPAANQEITKWWTDTTDKGDIADAPIAGKLNGVDTTIAYVKIKKWDDEYGWDFTNTEPSSRPCGLSTDDNAVHFSSKVLKTGTFEKKLDQAIEFDDYHSYYHYKQADGVPMSVNDEWAAKVVIAAVDETTKKVSGWARFEFKGDKTAIAGKFEADLCE